MEEEKEQSIPKLEISSEEIKERLRLIEDPELHMSIVDLGLIYDIQVKDNDIYVKFTLTTPACPLGDFLMEQIQEACFSIPNVRYVYPELVFDPPWDPRTMASEEAKLDLGIL